jgi:hypothetical protein
VVRAKYNIGWVGIDAGREGLWREPIWSDVLQIIANHNGERVYDASSPIYAELESRHPKEAWRSQTADGKFRPLFRDYPNSWTRLGVISLAGQRFKITTLGQEILLGQKTKTSLLVDLFTSHTESSGPNSSEEHPFIILAKAFHQTPRPLSTDEIFWKVMKNYRPSIDSLTVILKQTSKIEWPSPEPTPYRRLRNMLSLMRAANAISSTRRGTDGTYWNSLDRDIIKKISFLTENE